MELNYAVITYGGGRHRMSIQQIPHEQHFCWNNFLARVVDWINCFLLGRGEQRLFPSLKFNSSGQSLGPHTHIQVNATNNDPSPEDC